MTASLFLHYNHAATETFAGIVYRYYASFPRTRDGSDSRYPLQRLQNPTIPVRVASKSPHFINLTPMKKIICVLGLFMIVTPLAYAGFSDVPSDYQYSPAIDYVKDKGIVDGYTDGTFKPDAKINRAEFTKIIIAAKFTAEEIDSCVPVKKFPDVQNSEWYAKYICVAKNNEIIKGYPDGTFKPDNYINFAEASTIVVGTYELEFTPTDDPDHWYMPFVDALYLQAAVPITVTDFGKDITRGEMADVIFGVETDQGYVADEDVADDTGDEDVIDEEDVEGDEDVADEGDVDTGDDVADDTNEVYSAAEIRGYINDCSKIMLKQSDLPAGYTIDSHEVYRGGTPADNYADCYQYINFTGKTSDQYMTTIRYLVTESEEVTHQQMEIIRNEMPGWGWEDMCQSYIGGKLSYYVEGGRGYFNNGSITYAEDEMVDKLYDKAWDLTGYYNNANNGSNCVGVREDNPEFLDQSDQYCIYLAEDIASGAAEGLMVFFDNNGTLREDECYLEVPESFVKTRLGTFGNANAAWDFFHTDFGRKKLIFKTYTDQGFFYRDDAWDGVIEEYDSR